MSRTRVMATSLASLGGLAAWFGGSRKEELSLKTSIGGIPMQKILLNTPNPEATTTDNLRTIAASPATGAFTTRTSCPNFCHRDTIHQWVPWSSNDAECNTSNTNTINCLGYSSETLEYNINAVKQVQREMRDIKQNGGGDRSAKPAILSITGKAEEVAIMLQTIAKETMGHPVLVEINLSCPNIPGKPPISYDFECMKQYLSTVFSKGAHGLKVGVKTTPYFYDGQFSEAAKVLNSFPELAFVTCINTIGHGLVIDIETEAPDLPLTYGGLGGPVVHATALANVHKLRQLLRKDIDIIGVGGVDSGRAAFCHILCGASAVGLASALLTEGSECFERIEATLPLNTFEGNLVIRQSREVDLQTFSFA